MREFGLLKALGMRPWWSILRMVLTEAFFVLVLGMALGNLLGLVSVWFAGINGLDLSALAQGSEYVGMNRVMYPILDLKELMLLGNAMVLALGLLVCLYPGAQGRANHPGQGPGQV